MALEGGDIESKHKKNEKPKKNILMETKKVPGFSFKLVPDRSS